MWKGRIFRRLMFLIICFAVVVLMFYVYLSVSCYQLLHIIINRDTSYTDVEDKIKAEWIFSMIHDYIGMNAEFYLSETKNVRFSLPLLLPSQKGLCFYLRYTHDDTRSKSWDIRVKLYVRFKNPLSWEIIDMWEHL